MFYRNAISIAVYITAYNFVGCDIYRLPRDVKPVRYILTINPALADRWMDYTYDGSVIIEIKVLNHTRDIVLHSHRSIKIDYRGITVGTARETSNVIGASSNNTLETFTVHLEKELLHGRSYNLTLGHFSGHLGLKEGLFYARYWTKNATRRTIAATHFEPVGARKAFPCFDEPNLKAKFAISIIRKQEYMALSNEELESSEPLGKGLFRDTFRETPEMSTYLVAFAVSDFKTPVKRERHRIFGRPELVEKGQLDFALGVAVKALRILENYTGINYTFSKMDQFAVPDGYFPHRAMENWGLVIYGEQHIRCTNKASISDLKRITMYISHEFAHQWFGNLVTPEWWDYLWLSESFAFYFQHYVTSIIHPTMEISDEFVIDVLHPIFATEEFVKTSRLSYQIQYSNEIPPLDIIYKKGSSIVRMMSHVLGHDVFRKGLQIYLQNRKFKTATPSDLYNALQESVNMAHANHLLKNISVAEILKTWDVTGYPTVTVRRNYATGSILLQQNSIFTGEGARNIWNIPINFVFSSGGDLGFSKTTPDYWLTERSAVLSYQFPTTGWLIVNKQQTAGETLYECNRIDYFSKEKYSPDPNDSTLAIPYAVTKSIFFFILALCLLCGSYCCCILGQCIKHRRLYTFISGVAFIVSGLIMLLGLIVYISVFKAEVGSKLRPRSHIQPPAFTYHYGFSFLLYVCGFISTQLAGISAVFLFIYRMQHEWRRKHLEDIRRGKVQTPPPSINYVQLDHNMFYPCRRHPQAYINSNSSIHVPINFPSPVLHQRRYFFSKDPIQESPCSLHRNMSQSNSLKDISSSFYDFPPPPTISYQFEELKNFNRDTSRHFPRDVTTNTVSTTADINCDDFLPEPYDDYSPSIQHEHEFVTFDLDQPLPMRAQSTVSVNSRNDNGRKDFSSDTLRRTTPV